MRSGDEDEDPPVDVRPGYEAEGAQLDADLLADGVRLNELSASIQSLKIERVEVRVRFGSRLERQKEITKEGKYTDYVKRMADRWGFSARTANYNRAYAALYQHDSRRFSFANLANLGIDGVRRDYQEIFVRDDRAERIADELYIQAIDNAVYAALLVDARLNFRDKRQLLQFHQQGWDHEVFERWMAGFILRRGEPMSPEERRRGLSSFMMDSGAYTASTQGTEINIDDYCNFLLENPWITTYINLDVIDPTKPGTDESGLLSYNNFRHMRERGLNPIPVFHAGEEFSWLEKYIHEEGCDYIGLGGVADNRSTTRTMSGFDQCFEIIENCGRPIKTHAFGVAMPAILLKYPFDSADSSTWFRRAQRWLTTDISRVGGRIWREEIRDDPDTLNAARTYLEALDAHRFERQLREERDFNFYLVVRTNNPWWLPALWTVGHKNALMPYYQHLDPAIMRQFIDYPISILNREYYADRLELLEGMKDLQESRLDEQRRRQRVRDGVDT